MKQVVIQKGEYKVLDVPEPTPGPGDVLVRVARSLISTGTELAASGHSSRALVTAAARDPRRVVRVAARVLRRGVGQLRETAERADAPRPLGYSCAGVVIEAGEEAVGFKLGQLVACAGAGHATHAEVVSVPRNLVAHVPEGISPDQAATATVGAIALQGVRCAEVSVGDTVAVIGLGLVGQLTAQILRAAGAQVIGVDPDERRVELAEQLAAQTALCPENDNVLQTCLRLTGGHGVDACIIAAASADSEITNQALELVRKRGRAVIVGGVGLDLKRKPLYERELDLRLSHSYGPGRGDTEYEALGVDYPYAYVRWTEQRNLSAFLNLLRDGAVDVSPLIARRVPVEEAPEAYRALASDVPRPLAAMVEYPEGDQSQPRRPSLEFSVAPVSSSEGRIRLALVGGGRFAQSTHLPNLRALRDTYSLEAIVTRTPLNAATLARKWGARVATTDYRVVLADPDIDAVLIATPHETHVPMAIEASEAGKAVLLEKPMATSAEELEELLEALSRSRIPLTLGFNRRFAPLSARLAAAVRGRVGPLVANYRVNAGKLQPGRPSSDSRAEGRVVGEACHMFDYLNSLVGAAPSRVSASSASVDQGVELSRANFSATLTYADGSIGNLVYTSLGHAQLAKERLEVFWDGMALVLDDFKELTQHGAGPRPVSHQEPGKGHIEELREFAALCRGGPPPIPLDELVWATRTALDVDELVTRGQ